MAEEDGGNTRDDRKNDSIDDNDNNRSNNDKTTTTTRITSRIAFGSCHKAEKSSVPPIWETILPPTNAQQQDQIDAWLWLGDAMYPSHRDPVTNKKYYGPAPPGEVEAGLRAMKHENATIGYKGFLDRLYQSKEAQSESRKEGIDRGHLPLVTGVWDDHDFGGNDMGSNMPEKHERKRIYRSFLGHPSRATENRRRPLQNSGDETHNENENDDDDDSGEGMYHRVDLEGGKIRILVLDTRWFREDHCIPSVAHRMPKGNAVACFTRWMTSGLLLHKFAWLWGRGGCEHAKVLGDAQWAWLEHELLAGGEQQQQQPELFVVLSSIQVWSTNPIMEGWGHFPKEQERLWNLLRVHYDSGPAAATTGGLPRAPVLFLSGDVHHAEISGRQGYHEVTSSGMTHHCGQHKLYGYVCEPILKSFSDHRNGYDSNDNDRRDDYYIGLNYGELEILEEDDGNDSSTGERRPVRSVRATIRNATGHSVLEVSQPLAGHGPAPVLPPYHQLAHTWDGHLIPYLRDASLWALVGLVSVFFLRRLR
mmetsp:Transcript_17197/g.39261  ORF Transcript_17197/g.39261 Transcript_17197/m.39261 type:complete len:534 (+) Transcript_17197:103-1704(+)